MENNDKERERLEDNAAPNSSNKTEDSGPADSIHIQDDKEQSTSKDESDKTPQSKALNAEDEPKQENIVPSDDSEKSIEQKVLTEDTIAEPPTAPENSNNKSGDSATSNSIDTSNDKEQSIQKEEADEQTEMTKLKDEDEPKKANIEPSDDTEKSIEEKPLTEDRTAEPSATAEREDENDEGPDEGPQDSDNDEEEEEEEQHLDYSEYTVKQMVQVVESLLKEDNLEQIGRILKEIKKSYDELFNATQKEAFEKYLAEGGEKDGFEYRQDEYDMRFHRAYNKLKEKRSQFYNSLEKQKEQNLLAKQEILDKIRELVDAEETNASIKDLKELQESWKKIGIIPPSQAKSLWANYNALLDRFYDQRSIYFELKELDRKKNYDLKIELCEKAELLAEEKDVREAIRQLNELHEEFKHIGPVPKEDQDAVWERFKLASDKIYIKRKDFYEKLKGELKLNETAKEALAEKVKAFAEFDSQKISDWNAKTKEIIAVQKEWEKIGSLPKERAKEINKRFWTSFKSFFNNKNGFFKKIDEERKGNLILKQELAEKAESLKDSEDFRKTSEELKQLQIRWKEIGPVPEKNRNEVYFKFKKACDHFFTRRRNNSGKLEKEYEENLKLKMTLCDELEKMISTKTADLKRVKEIEKEWNEIGFVPKANIRSIQKRYTDAIGKITDKADISETEKHKIRFSAQFNTENYGPGTEKLIQKKEGALRRQISALENEINLWKNNIDFFASSKNADKLKKDFQLKIDSAQAQLKSLKEQLKVISNI